MQIDPDLHDFIDQQQRELPPPRDPTDMAAQAQRYAALSRRLPSVLVPVTSGDFKLRPGGKPLPARMHWPTGAQAPVLMAWFVGGGWAAGDLDTHDGLCRQLAHDLGVAVACVQLPPAAATRCCKAVNPRCWRCARCWKAAPSWGCSPGGCWWAATAAAATPRCRRPGAWPACSRAAWTRCWGLCPLVKPDFNTASYIRCASSPVFSRTDAIRAWHNFLQGQWDLWDERAVLMHGNAPIQNPPVTVLLAAEQDVAHDDAIQLHDWLRMVGARCEFFGAPRMTHDFARMQHASDKAPQAAERRCGRIRRNRRAHRVSARAGPPATIRP